MLWPNTSPAVKYEMTCIFLNIQYVWNERELVIHRLSVCPSPGALHQSECEEKCLSEHTESGCPTQRVLHHLLRHTHTSHICVCVCGLVHVLSDLTVQTWNQYNPHRSPHPCSSCDLRPHRHTDRRKERAKNSAHGLPSPSCVCGCALSLTKCRVAMVPGV